MQGSVVAFLYGLSWSLNADRSLWIMVWKQRQQLKCFFFSPGRNVKKMNFTFNLQMIIFSASY